MDGAGGVERNVTGGQFLRRACRSSRIAARVYAAPIETGAGIRQLGSQQTL